ncbi:MAG TPA: citrate synthase [Longimicrobiales bacterium]|nr:citrate synthase [Longimicrobiales bacterium]
MTSKGLEGVVAAETTLSKVFGEEGRLVYAGYEIEDLAANASFEEVCWLLWNGELPTTEQLEQLSAELSAAASIDDRIIDILRLAPADTHPMATLRTAASALGFYDPEAEDMSDAANRRKAVRITARIPTITAAIDRVRKGLEPIEPDPSLRLGGNFLYMLTGQAPDGLGARIVDAALTLHAEHGLNASTFAARVTAATLADMHSAVTSAIGALKGPLHGGANERVMEMLQKIGSADQAEQWITAALERKEKIMGFGHRVYRTTDPRAPILRDLSGRLGSGADETPWLDISEKVVEVMRREMDARGKKIYPNVDFFSASVYYTIGIPTDLFTNVFAMARAAGWTAHVIEQLADNRLIRPKAEYKGPLGKKVVPIADRG